jgi:predicted RNA polymerase sigma factor
MKYRGLGNEVCMNGQRATGARRRIKIRLVGFASPGRKSKSIRIIRQLNKNYVIYKYSLWIDSRIEKTKVETKKYGSQTARKVLTLP